MSESENSDDLIPFRQAMNIDAEFEELDEETEPGGCRYNDNCEDGMLKQYDSSLGFWRVTGVCRCYYEERESDQMWKDIEDVYGEQSPPDALEGDGTFDSYEEQEHFEAYKVATRYAQNFSDVLADGHWLYIYGPVGLGKSHLIWAIWNEVSERVPSLVVSAPTLIEELKPGNDKIEKRKKLIKNVAFLALDDLLRHRKDSEYVFELFSDLIDYRYRNKLPTVITTNFDLQNLVDETSKRWTPIQDRIAGLSTRVEMTGQSYRLKGDGNDD